VLTQAVCSAAQHFILLGISGAAEQGQTEGGKQSRIPAGLVTRQTQGHTTSQVRQVDLREECTPSWRLLDALEHFRQGGDLADQLILARASRVGALPLLSCDQRFSGHEGVQRLSADFPSTDSASID
jgi:hypothetical protein